MTDQFDNKLQSELRRLEPRKLSNHLEEQILGQLEQPMPTNKVASRRRLLWLVGTALGLLAVLVVVTSIWQSRNKKKQLVDARESIIRGSVQREIVRAPLRSDLEQYKPPVIDAELDSEVAAAEAGGTAQQPAKVGQSRIENAQSGQSAANNQSGGTAQSSGGVGINDSQKSGATAQMPSWHVIAESELVGVSVERALYEIPDSDEFFVKVQITNRINREIGVELHDYNNVIAPNQWGVHSMDRRVVIDESRIEAARITSKLKGQMITAFKEDQLTFIRPKQSVTYFRSFNGSKSAGRAAIKRHGKDSAGHFLILSIDGQLIFTDGETVNEVNCEWNDKLGPHETDVVIKFPITWKPIPKMSLVIERR